MNSEHPASATAFSPSTSDELRAFLIENFGGAKRPIVPVGGGTSFEGRPPLAEQTVKVATSGLDRVVEFAARDMTVTVEAGISISRLDEVLRGEGLRLPIDIPQWERATLGGAVAANASGPRRFGQGTFRDYVIGLTAMKADGQVFHSGGRVVKNVAGYDLCKLLVGSKGTLAIVTQVTLKLKPLPEASALVCAAFADLAAREAALAGLLTSQTRPVAIDTLNAGAAEAIENELRIGIPTGGPALIVGFEGTQRETDWQIVTLFNEFAALRPLGQHVVRNADAAPLWSALTELSVSHGDWPVFEAQMLPSKIVEFERAAATLPVEIAARAGNGRVFAKRAGIDAVSSKNAHLDADVFARLSAIAGEQCGAFGISRGERGSGLDWADSRRGEKSRELMGRLKAAFDPANLLPPISSFTSS
jgi:glycolate oxidase FAD binding subunit